jgi:hypothetical protein
MIRQVKDITDIDINQLKGHPVYDGRRLKRINITYGELNSSWITFYLPMLKSIGLRKVDTNKFSGGKNNNQGIIRYKIVFQIDPEKHKDMIEKWCSIYCKICDIVREYENKNTDLNTFIESKRLSDPTYIYPNYKQQTKEKNQNLFTLYLQDSEKVKTKFYGINRQIFSWQSLLHKEFDCIPKLAIMGVSIIGNGMFLVLRVIGGLITTIPRDNYFIDEDIIKKFSDKVKEFDEEYKKINNTNDTTLPLDESSVQDMLDEEGV